MPLGSRIGQALRRLVGTQTTRGPLRRPAAPRPTGDRGALDYRGKVTITYDPHPDGCADPGEVVWTWVPFEEDSTQGKDRPVLVIGTAPQAGADQLAVLMLSSKDHGADPNWLPLGPGAWDRDGRPSCVRLDRVLMVAPGDVRREGSSLDRARFEILKRALQARSR